MEIEDNVQGVMNKRKAPEPSADHIPAIDARISRYEELMNTFDIVKLAVKSNGLALLHASDRLQDNDEIVKLAVKSNGLALEFASKRLQSDYSIVLAAVENNSDESKRLQPDHSIVLAAVENIPDTFQYMSKELQDNKKIVLQALNDPYNIKYVSERLRHDEEVVITMLNQDDGDYGPWELLESMPDAIKDNERIIMHAIPINGYVLRYASARLRDDYRIVFAAVTSEASAYSLNYASERLQDDYGVAVASINSCIYVDDYCRIFDLVSDRLKNDFTFVNTVINIIPSDLEYGRMNSDILEYVSNEMRSEKIIMRNACKKWSDALKYVSDELKDDRQFIVEAVKRHGMALEYASIRLRGDILVVKSAVMNDIRALKFASEDMKTHNDVITLTNELSAITNYVNAERKKIDEYLAANH